LKQGLNQVVTGCTKINTVISTNSENKKQNRKIDTLQPSQKQAVLDGEEHAS
jgi:aspartate/glutamate racemase